MSNAFDNIVNNLINKARVVNPDDYVLSNKMSGEVILHCGKCNKPKEQIIQIGNEFKKVPMICLCQKAEYEAAEKKESAEKLRQHSGRLRKEAFDDNNLELCTFDNDSKPESKLSKFFHRYVDNWERVYKENSGLILWGSCGTGKSFYAACVANALIDKGIPVLMTNFFKLSNMINKDFTNRNEILESINKYKLLILDDLGVERSTDYMIEQVYSIVDTRYKSKKPTIITTNLNWSDISNNSDARYERIYDRIISMCVPIQITGESNRRKENIKKTELISSFFE